MFNTLKLTAQDDPLKNVIPLVVRDEAWPVTFGVTYLQEYVQDQLSDEEIKERARFE